MGAVIASPRCPPVCQRNLGVGPTSSMSVRFAAGALGAAGRVAVSPAEAFPASGGGAGKINCWPTFSLLASTFGLAWAIR
jgi:hypothetical protein